MNDDGIQSIQVFDGFGNKPRTPLAQLSESGLNKEERRVYRKWESTAKRNESTDVLKLEIIKIWREQDRRRSSQ
jgi:hypothetical protein